MSNLDSLFNITDDYITVRNMLYEENADMQAITDTLESIAGDFEDKADNYVYLMKELKSKAKARKEAAKQLEDSAKVLENRADRLKENLFKAMKATRKTKFATNMFSYSIAKNSGVQPLKITGEVPEEYTIAKIENNNDKIRQALEAGEELTFAHLEPRGESLRIK